MVDERVEFSDTLEQVEDSQYVEVMFARTTDEASTCRTLLEEHLIPARVATGGPDSDDRGVALLVPDSYQDDALEILAMRAQDDDAEEEEETEGDDEFDDDDDVDDDDDLDDDDDDEEEFDDDE